MRKNKILIVGVLMFILCGPDFYAQSMSPRYIMFCDGNVNTTSLGWSDLILKMYARNSNNQPLYNFQDYTWVDPFQYQNSLVQGVPQLENFLDESIVNANATDVLGLGHCIGGLGLRLAQQRNPNITGMVLNGVPNSGSKMMYNLIYKSPGSGKTRPQELLSAIKRLTGADNCKECGAIDAFADWVDQFSAGASHLNYAASLLSNRNYGDPTQPYVNMYGLLEPSDFSFVRMLDSRIPGRNLYQNCINERRNIERATDLHKKQIETIKSTTNFITGMLNTLSGILKIASDPKDGVANVAKLFSDRIKADAENQIRQIEKQFEKDQETARRLRCILAQQLLEAEWLIMMGGEYEAVEVEENDSAGYYDCLFACENQNYPFPNDIYICISDCYQHYYENVGTGIIKTFITFIPEPNDGLYTQSEMRLPSGLQRGQDIIFQGVDHFQETTSDQVHHVFFNQIFTGVQPYGPEFFVPKN